jgi:hypothetical protein
MADSNSATNLLVRSGRARTYVTASRLGVPPPKTVWLTGQTEALVAKAKVESQRRRFHGGLSTGPRTAEGEAAPRHARELLQG